MHTSLLLALLAASASAAPSAHRDGDSRPQDGAHAFVGRDGTYTARSPERGIDATFDVDGAWLSHDSTSVGVRVTAWGRLDPAWSDATVREALLDSVAPALGDDARVDRIEYARGGLTEWWTATEEGLEQGWTVTDRPEGDEPLTIELGIDGATASASDDEVWLDGDDGGAWRVTALTAWDADGVRLPARFEATSDGLRVIVDDADARYPIVVDPVYTTASTTLYSPVWGYFGSAVSGAGDVNGDGYADVVVGADVYDSYTGRAYVYLGSAGGLSTTPSVTLSGDSHGIFGFTTAAAGDINGDGYDDIIVGQEGPDPYVGRAYGYYGSPTGIAATADVILDGFAAGTYFGTDVGGAGDVNGDGYADVIVGALGTSTVAGAAYVYLGSAGGLATSPCATLAAPTGIIGYGRSADGAGDVNGDGYADVIVGAEGDDGHAGKAFVYHGGARCLSSKPATTLSGLGVGDYFGTGASGVGDVNGDGYDDVAVGAYRARSWSGRVNVYQGSAGGIHTTPAVTLNGLGMGWFGIHLEGAGDVNADGYADMIVGAPNLRTGTGAATVYEGSAAGITTTSRTILNGSSTGSMFGYEVSGAGDVNGDGLDDVLVGAYGEDGGAGRAYVYEGY